METKKYLFSVLINKYIDEIFMNCSSLLSLPDISKWNLNNIKTINNILTGCSSLLSFPDILSWNLHNKLNKSYIYNLTKESLSSQFSSIGKNIIESDNINSSSFINNSEKLDINKDIEYKINDVDFYKVNDSLTLYYDNFYSEF